MVQRKPATILMVEDNPTDQMLTRRALKKAKVTNEVIVHERAEDALEHLQRQDTPCRPDLILLDLSLPGMSGQEFLEVVKQNDELKYIPVAALTSSASDADVLRSWDLGVVAYLVKPVGLAELQEALTNLTGLYLEFVVYPEAKGSPKAPGQTSPGPSS